jgi:hypothetical protein
MSTIKVANIQNLSSQDIRGKILQVKQTFYNDGNSSWGTISSPTDIMTVTLTTTVANSRFFIDACLYYAHGAMNSSNPDAQDIYLFCYRDSTKIGNNTQATRDFSSGGNTTGGWYVSDVPRAVSSTYGYSYVPLNENFKYIDSPGFAAGTSTTYSIKFMSQGSMFLNRSQATTTSAACSALTIFEIAP